jgi:hypothetical protein
MRSNDTRTDQPLKEEVPPPPVEPHSSIEAKLMKSIWRVIKSFNDPSMTSVDNRTGLYRIHGPFDDHLNEMFDMFHEYREQLELMRKNLIEAADRSCAAMEPRLIGPTRRQVFRSMVEEINDSFDSLCIGCYDSELHLINENVSDDDQSLFSNSLDENADEDESK